MIAGQEAEFINLGTYLVFASAFVSRTICLAERDCENGSYLLRRS